MNKIIILILTMVSCGIFSTVLRAETDSSGATVKQSLKVVYPARITLGRKTDGFSNYKVRAALNLAAYISRRYTVMPQRYIDSIASLEENASKPIAEIAAEAGAEELFVLRVNRLANIVRVDILALDPNDENHRQEGTGYGNIHHFNQKTEQALLDPALLEAMQRALADLSGDSLMYDIARDHFRVFPVPTVVIGGLEFSNDSLLKPWDMFGAKETIVNSYDVVETILEEARKSNDYVFYDNESRDSLYSIFNLYLVENGRPPSITEIDALQKFEVGFYITGKLQRTPEGATAMLSLCRIENSRLNCLKTVEGQVKEDNIVVLRNELRRLTDELLEIK